MRSYDDSQLLTTPLSLRRLLLMEIGIPRREPFQSAIGARLERRALLVRWIDQEGAWGIGECSCRTDPFFNGEFIDGAVRVLRDHIFPRLPVQGTLRDVAAVLATARGWPFTRAGVLDAVFDLLRRRGERDGLDQWPTPPQERIPVGLSLPVFAAPDVAVGRVERAVAAGFQRIKLKVASGTPLGPLQAVREAFPYV